MNYVPLYIKTENSLLTSLIKIDELIKCAKDYNYKTLSIVDDNMFGVMEFYKKCLKNDIKPIIGLEIILDESQSKRFADVYAKILNDYKSHAIGSDPYKSAIKKRMSVRNKIYSNFWSCNSQHKICFKIYRNFCAFYQQ